MSNTEGRDFLVHISHYVCIMVTSAYICLTLMDILKHNGMCLPYGAMYIALCVPRFVVSHMTMCMIKIDSLDNKQLGNKKIIIKCVAKFLHVSSFPVINNNVLVVLAQMHNHQLQ